MPMMPIYATTTHLLSTDAMSKSFKELSFGWIWLAAGAELTVRVVVVVSIFELFSFTKASNSSSETKKVYLLTLFYERVYFFSHQKSYVSELEDDPYRKNLA